MCNPPNRNRNQQQAKERRRVVISGAGPAGVLLACILLDRNKDENCGIAYDVTLLDGRPDYGSIPKQEMQEKYRSWMIGLADHGMDAIKTLPALYENYVKGEGIMLKEFSILLGAKKVTYSTDDVGNRNVEAYIVDRNFIVAAIARYLKDTHENDPHYSARYETKCQYVDYDNKRVLVREINNPEKEEYLDYDLLVGCDGVRSVVREALVKRHSDFYLEYTDIFTEFKAVHVAMPKGMSQDGMTVLPNPIPHCQGILLPETGGLANLALGCNRHMFEDHMADELKSEDYKVVAEYMRKNLVGFELVDYEDFAKQWVGQRWNQTGMVHCNFYHSLKAGIVLMGDAAHATSPAIGMGMNTAFRDAQIFCEILRETEDDLDKALPAFSKARVKEGNALTDLAFHLNCLDSTTNLMAVVHQIVRGFFFKWFPSLVKEHPFSMIGRRGIPLSTVYERAVEVGIINKHRVINDRMRQEFFEEKSGMITKNKSKGGMLSKVVVFGAVGATVAAVSKYITSNV